MTKTSIQPKNSKVASLACGNASLGFSFSPCFLSWSRIIAAVTPNSFWLHWGLTPKTTEVNRKNSWEPKLQIYVVFLSSKSSTVWPKCARIGPEYLFIETEKLTSPWNLALTSKGSSQSSYVLAVLAYGTVLTYVKFYAGSLHILILNKYVHLCTLWCNSDLHLIWPSDIVSPRNGCISSAWWGKHYFNPTEYFNFRWSKWCIFNIRLSALCGVAFITLLIPLGFN